MGNLRYIAKIDFNKYLTGRKNLYIVDYREVEEIKPLVETRLENVFNIIYLKYDLLNCHHINNGAELIIKEFIDMLSDDEDYILLGHSFNGYIAFKIAVLCQNARLLVMIDTRNFLIAGNQTPSGAFKSLYQNLIRQVFFNKDYAYPFFLGSSFLRKVIKGKNSDFDTNFLKAITCFLKAGDNAPANCDCLFFKANRSSFRDVEFGLNWTSYITGKFYLKTVISGHNEMISRHAPELANEIIFRFDGSV